MEAVSWGREQLCSAEWQPLVHVLLFMEEDICPRLDTSRFFHTANTHSYVSNIFKCTKGISALLLLHNKLLAFPRRDLEITATWANPQLEMVC